MTTFRKTVTATLAALTLATTFIASGAEARPRWGYGYGGWGWYNPGPAEVRNVVTE